MTDSQLTHPTPENPGGRRGRRAVLAAGATAAIGAVGAVLAKPAEAAAGGPLLLGRSNSSGSLNTLVSSSTTSAALSASSTAGHGLLGDARVGTKWGVLARNLATATGGAGAVLGEGKVNIGVLGRTTNPNQYGIVASNTSPVVGSSGALVAEGGVNPGVVAFTNAPIGVNNAPAIFADGGVGAWASWLVGDEVVDGTLFAAFTLVGVQGAAGIAYREAVSGEAPFHTHSGRVTLDAAGNGSVTVTADFLAAANLAAATTSVQLTAMVTAMPSLAATITATGFTVSGGAADGSVSWTVTAPRRGPGAAAAAGAKALRSGRTAATRRAAGRPRRADA